MIDVLFNHVGHVADNLRVASSIDITVAASKRLAHLLTSDYDVPNRVETIYVGIDGDTSATERASELQRTSWRRLELPLLVWLGRFSEEKRPDWFIRLAKELHELADFAMAGDGPRLAEVEAAARSIDSLHYLGVVENPLDVVAAADLLVLTSVVEGIPLVAMEAVARGTPLLSTAVGGIPEFVRETGAPVPARVLL